MALYDQINRALEKTASRSRDGLEFSYPGAKPNATGVKGRSRVDVKSLDSGPQDVAHDTFTVAKSWFAREPSDGGQLIAGGRSYIVTKVETDEISYEFTILDRGSV